MDLNFLEYFSASRQIKGDRIRDILQVHKETNEEIYSLIIREGLATEEDLGRAAGVYYKTSVVDISQVKVDPRALKFATQGICTQHYFLPFGLEQGDTLRVAIANYACSEIVSKYLRSQGLIQIKFYIAPLQSLLRAISVAFQQRFSESNTSLGSRSSMRPASILKQHFALEELENEKGNQLSIARNSLRTGEFRPLSSQADFLRIAELEQSVENLRSENSRLRQEIGILSLNAQKESALLRQLLETLLAKGLISEAVYANWQ